MRILNLAIGFGWQKSISPWDSGYIVIMGEFFMPMAAVVVTVAPHAVRRVRAYPPGSRPSMCFVVSPTLRLTERTTVPSSESSSVALSSSVPSTKETSMAPVGLQ